MSNSNKTESNIRKNSDSEKNLTDYLNAFFKIDSPLLDSEKLEEALSCIEKFNPSMRNFLEALANTLLWQEWQFKSNTYFSMILHVGSEIDRLASLKVEPTYHSKLHMIDVCLMMTCLLSGEKNLPQENNNSYLWQTSHSEKWLLLLSAASHDLGHPGLMNSFPYEIEQNSLHHLESLLVREGYDCLQVDDVMQNLRPWILATDHAQYTQLIKRLEGLTLSHTDCMAMLLVEADLVSSVLPNRGRILTIRLSQEWENLYKKQSEALLNLLGYLRFLEGLKFISPHSNVFHLSTVLKNTIKKLKSESN